MNSSTSNSDDRNADRSSARSFLGWVVAINALAWLVCSLVPWGGILISQESHRRVGQELGEKLDFLVVGDSKAGPFSTDCVMPWLPPYRGAVFSADSVTPVFHLETLRRIRESNPSFAPEVVFVLVGANNLNANGLHASRDFAYFMELPIDDAYAFAVGRGEALTFAEAVLSRVFPVYGQRVNITHLYVGSRGAARCPDPDEHTFERQSGFEFPAVARDPIADRNYFDIYRRSMYASYRSSAVEVAALDELIKLIKSWGGTPVILLPSVTREIRDLEHELIGDAFDASIDDVATRNQVEVLDLRDVRSFEFADVNHLSKRGAHDLARGYLFPVLRKSLVRSAGSRGPEASTFALRP